MDDQLRAFVAAQVADQLLRFRLVRFFNVPSPAPGQDVFVTVPAGVTWEILTARCLFTTSAVVASRANSLVLNDQDGLQVFRANANTTIAASSSGQITWASGLGYAGSSGGLNGPLPSPPLIAPSGYVVRTITGSIDVADQYAQFNLQVREWSAGQVAQHMEKVLADTFALRIADREI